MTYGGKEGTEGAKTYVRSLEEQENRQTANKLLDAPRHTQTGYTEIDILAGGE